MLAHVHAPRHGGVEHEGRILADEETRQGIGALDGAVLRGIEGLESTDDLARRKRLELELVVGRLRDALGNHLALAEERIEALRVGRGHTPTYFRLRLRNGRGRNGACRGGQARAFENFSSVHEHFLDRFMSSLPVRLNNP